MSRIGALNPFRWDGKRRRPASGLVPAGSRRRPRLLTDVSVIARHDAQTGIQRVVRAILSHLQQHSGTNFDLVPVFATRTRGFRVARSDFLSGAGGPIEGGKLHVEAGDRFLGLDLNAHLLPSWSRQLSSWRRRGATTHMVVYDLLPLQHPQWFGDKTVRNFERWIEVVRLHCDQALCISDQVATELRSHLAPGAARPSIERIRLAGDIEGSRPSKGIDAALRPILDHMRKMPAVLMVGTIEPRKAYDVAMPAFEYLWETMGDEAPSLVIAGKCGWRTEMLQERLRNHPEQGRRLFWLPDISDEGLVQLYHASQALLLTSRAEGFGLPAIEAAMHGRHALVRDLPVFREQRLPNLSYFSDESPAVLAAELVELLRRSNNPPPAVALPSWQDCIGDLLKHIGLGEPVPTVQATPRSHVAA